jgi:hypothetical protein
VKGRITTPPMMGALIRADKNDHGRGDGKGGMGRMGWDGMGWDAGHPKDERHGPS